MAFADTRSLSLLPFNRRFAKLEQQPTSADDSASANICRAQPFVSECEALVALSMCNNDEACVVRKLQNYDFLMQVRKAVCVQFCQPCTSKDETLGRKAGVGAEPDDPLDNTDDEQRSWSASRRMSYKNVSNSPNAYFYSYTEPGQLQKHGAWTQDEHSEFLAHIEHFGGWEKAGEARMRWGLFSRKIAGRVGYQCSNYYLHLQRVKRKNKESECGERENKRVHDSPNPQRAQPLSHPGDADSSGGVGCSWKARVGAGIRIGDLMLGRYKRALGYVGWYECKVVEEVEGGRWVVEWKDGDEHDRLKESCNLKQMDATAEHKGYLCYCKGQRGSVEEGRAEIQGLGGACSESEYVEEAANGGPNLVCPVACNQTAAGGQASRPVRSLTAKKKPARYENVFSDSDGDDTVRLPAARNWESHASSCSANWP